MSLKCTMILGDCLEVMPTLPRDNASLCFADIPYGSTKHSWDMLIPLRPLEERIWSFLNGKGNIIATANERFMHHLTGVWRHYKYSLIWNKGVASNFLNAAKRPLCAHEFVCVFAQAGIYIPQKTTGHKPARRTCGKMSTFTGAKFPVHARHDSGTQRHPLSILYFRHDKKTRRRTSDQTSTHPSQKPVGLIDWLVRAYSELGTTVIDPTSGSGTTAIAALQNNRHCVLIEKNPTYFGAAVERIRKHVNDNRIDAIIEVRC